MLLWSNVYLSTLTHGVPQVRQVSQLQVPLGLIDWLHCTGIALFLMLPGTTGSRRSIEKITSGVWC
jgi:hypothetical protein